MGTGHRSRRSSPIAVGTVLITLIAGACASTPTPTAPAAAPSDPPAPSVGASGAPSVARSGAPSAVPVAAIPQPADPPGLPVAPMEARVDLALPTFSDPTTITNPLFPVSRQASVVMLGQVDGLPFRTEVTLLPGTRTIDWQGMRVETLVSQYNAFLDGRITEIAYDYYAQADDGSVWYFGEDVYDFVDGAIVTTAGTWIAGPDIPAAMIMPGDPQVGDVYRPENAPGFVFEEVTVTDVGVALAGPLGLVDGGLAVSELHADGTYEAKLFGPGYGEFQTGGGADVEAIALAVPTDSLQGPVPSALVDLTRSVSSIDDLTVAGSWPQVLAAVQAAQAAFASLPTAVAPTPIAERLDTWLGALATATAARDAGDTRSAAIEVGRLAYDLHLRSRPTTEVDVARTGLWATQILVDAAAEDAAGVDADVFAIDYLRDRFIHSLAPSDATRLNVQIGILQDAVIDDDLVAAGDAATTIRDIVRDLLPAG